MTIYTVQKGDTISSIAEKYNIPETRLVRDNELSPDVPLNIGQNLIITYPEKTYIVQNGDSINSILSAFGISRIQLLRNNPQLSNSAPLIPGEELVISYNNKDKKIKVNGFANVFINMEILKKTLPFLTYITILNYRVSDDGSLVDITDTEVVQMAKEYGVAPLMFISTFNEFGVGGYGVIHKLLNDPEMQNRLIHSVLTLLSSKGYYGLYLGFEHILKDDLQQYADFVKIITDRLNTQGYVVFTSLVPSTFAFKPGTPYEEPYFSEIGQAANFVTLITYQWTTATIPLVAETTPAYLKKYLDFVITQIPPEKIYLGLTRIAYEWELPYVEGETQGRFLTNSGAINLAEQVNATIQYDEATQTPYFYYNSLAGVQHFVWFKDAKTIDYIMNLVIDNGLEGVAIWNIMYYYPPTYIVINTQYDIESVI